VEVRDVDFDHGAASRARSACLEGAAELDQIAERVASGAALQGGWWSGASAAAFAFRGDRSADELRAEARRLRATADGISTNAADARAEQRRRVTERERLARERDSREAEAARQQALTRSGGAR
jgi:hypothetical protein